MDRMNDVTEDATDAFVMSNNNERYSRRSNIRILRIPESKNEILKESICEIFNNNLKIKFHADELVATHRLPSRLTQYPKPITLKFEER